jgi:hypothetical protein
MNWRTEMPEDDECEWVKDSCGYYCRTHDGGCSILYGEHDAKLEKHECDRCGDYLRATMKSVKKEAYAKGQLHPSSQTIREIEAKLAEKVKEEIRNHLRDIDRIREKFGTRSHAVPHAKGFNLGLATVEQIIIDQLLQDGGD